MKIKTLENIPFEVILNCFLESFSDYYVKMPQDSDYYKIRWKAAKVDFRFSYGMFDEEKLVGLIIHGIDFRDGEKVAFNTGTGVIPNYRGQKITSKIYDFALKHLKENDFTLLKLEVIRENQNAIHVYQKVGFEICKKYKCYISDFENIEVSSLDFEIKSVEKENFNWNYPNEIHSWDNHKNSITSGESKYFYIQNKDKIESYFIINSFGNISQFQIIENNSINKIYERLFYGINSKINPIKLINIEEQYEEKIQFIEKNNFKTIVDQFEMEMKI
ncbi:GNAT family N-acetyltransferase [Aureivirga sp. CE67]|uniref:GNAT family N-acetyltransferase n=1 Tax=Aureivirga sp. CE67 TaxID=1788983 RepID=UPI0018C95809|nr:GNAT family N-acetyltransferase [Aureivirga sp. CE67]